MHKSILFSLLYFVAVSSTQAQSLYMPRDISKAFKKGTRSESGRPGKNYWQNHGRYVISITSLPPDRTVKGSEQITYFNNSPDTLEKLNIKLILNIHRPGAIRFYNADKDYLTEGLKVDSIFIAGQKVEWDNEPIDHPGKRGSHMADEPGNTTNKFVSLATPLLPHDSVKLAVTWHYQLSLQSGREGVIDSTSFYLAYFYPRVSVYDDYNGWDRLDFNDRQEFYNDFNDYILNVTVPKNYIVWATGNLQNTDKVLQSEYIKRLQAADKTDSVVHIATAADLEKKDITTQNDVNTWIWKATNVSDMAVGISNHYDWDAASTVVDDATGRRASMQAAFADGSADFHNAVKAGVFSLNWFSHNWPGVPYPFPKMTAFQGFADMEFPMMVNDEHEADIPDAALLQDHEMVHTYFPFYMGINETRYGYMDEGWATTFELLINEKEIGEQPARDKYRNGRIRPYITDAVESEDLPIITPTSELRNGYAHNAYGKASLSYLAIKDLLGDALFKKALHTYMDNWNGKHPVPWDYFNSMNAGTGKNLNWFFYNWFFTNGYIDISLEKVTKDANGYLLSVKNIGGYAVPFDVKVTYTDGTTGSFHQTPGVWEYNQKQISIHINTDKTVLSATLDTGIFMDADDSNNKWAK